MAQRRTPGFVFLQVIFVFFLGGRGPFLSKSFQGEYFGGKYLDDFLPLALGLGMQYLF